MLTTICIKVNNHVYTTLENIRKDLKLKNLRALTSQVLDGYQISKEEALFLYTTPLEELCACADEIRHFFCKNTFDLCTIINGKCARCSQDCKFCAQSALAKNVLDSYPLKDTKALLKDAKQNASLGITRYSIVTAGKCLSDKELDQICESIRCIKAETSMDLCVSLGLLHERQFLKLKEAGIERIHCNLETSRNYFPSIVTAHTYDDKLATIRAAKHVGLSICCGGLMGLGETRKDRIDMALQLRDLEITSIPINFLNPIPGTVYENQAPLSRAEQRRIFAIYRFLLPNAFLRLAGGRSLMKDQGKSCMRSGANAAITGDLLTTSGITVDTDLALLKELGYQLQQDKA